MCRRMTPHSSMTMMLLRQRSSVSLRPLPPSRARMAMSETTGQ
nr:TPA_asm: m105.4 sORF [Murid betaherpesvirus 1]DBA08057.1 TPA_asm: m105.4 sORF [Murid betaherpesvirus 1]